MRSTLPRVLGLVVLAVLTAGAAAQVHIPAQPVPDQFAVPAGPPAGFTLDTVKGELVSFETMMAKPIIITSNDQFVIVANEADDRLVVLSPALGAPIAEIALGQGLCAIAERPGASEIWVTMRHQMGIAVIDTTTWVITHLVRPAIPATVAGARFADSPSGIVFNASGSKAYVAASSTDHLLVFDAATKAPLASVPLASTHNGLSTHMNEPFAIARTGGLIVVASYRSGNQTLTEAGTNTLPITPFQMTDLTAGGSTRSLPDFDLLVVDSTTDAVVDVERGVGTLLHGIAAVDANGHIVVSNTESMNGTFIGEGSFRNGLVVRNRLTYVDLNAASGTPHVIKVTENLVPASNPWVNVVQPTDIAIDSAARVFVAGYGSSNIGVFTTAGVFLGLLPAEAGPLGLAYSAGLDRLFCFNRAEGSVTSYDLSGGTLPGAWLARAKLVDPTFDTVVRGRKVFLDATHSSKGTSSCASCHAHARNDGTAWDLSKFHDSGSQFTVAAPPSFWKDRKGVMQTQDLRSLEEVPGYHWRGEQKDIEDFGGVFPNLLKGTVLTNAEMADMKQYIFSARYPANPFQMLNRDFSALGGVGATAFLNDPADGQGPCNACHAVPTGTDAGTTDALRNSAGTDLSTKTAQLRGLWEKASDQAEIDDTGLASNLEPMTGTGFLHHGGIDSVDAFMTQFFNGVPHKNEIRALLDEFDTGIAPAANYCEILDRTHANNGQFLIDQATAQSCDLAVRGWMFVTGAWRAVGWYYDTTIPGFVPNDSALGSSFTLTQLRATTAGGNARWLMMGVPRGSGERMGIDRDRDMIRDLDEVALGTDPADPDTDGDGYWDGYESDPLNAGLHGVPVSAPTVTASAVEWVNTNAIKITYQTSTLSPTRVIYGPSGGALTAAAGDAGFPFGTGAGNTTNLWKRRHTVFIRVVDANTAYDFQIVTQGQNGVTATTGLQTATTRQDSFVKQIRVSTLALAQVTTGGTTTWTATATMVNRQGNPMSGVTVNVLFTRITAGAADLQTLVSGTTNGSGVAQVTWSVAAQTTGDGMAADIPMVDPLPTSGIPGASLATWNFVWPEGDVAGAKTIL
jgi:DNA-binding beta-propeller fold protein YncE